MKVKVTRLSAGVRRLSDVVAENVDFLWHPYFPLSKVVLIEGDPGIGKSWLSLNISIAIASGSGLPGMKKRRPRRVLLLTAEDGLEDTVRPRLDKMLRDHDAPADVLDRIHALDAPIVFDEEGTAQFERAVRSTRAQLVIVDPFVAYLGKVDFHKANETRKVMAKLAAIAQTHQCTIVLIRHLTKSGKDKSIYRGQGSIDITAACRSVLLVGVDPGDPAAAAIVHIKSNLAKTGATQGYTLEDGRFKWTGVSTLTAPQLFAAERDTSAGLAEAIDWLRAQLKTGPRASKDLKDQAQVDGLTWRTLERAKKSLQVRSFSAKDTKGKLTAWHWELTDQS